MNDITKNFTALYKPEHALVFYKGGNGSGYVELFDINEGGHMINAHPLSEDEAEGLARTLKPIKEERDQFLIIDGIIPSNVLHIKPGKAAVWYVKASKRMLLFQKGLGINSGQASIPALMFCATRKHLNVYALKNSKRPDIKSKLFDAPFFNISGDGRVCMGTVSVKFGKNTSLKEFMDKWEGFFFNSYFSHLQGGHNPVKGNCVTLWKELIETRGEFPSDQLKSSKMTISNILR